MWNKSNIKYIIATAIARKATPQEWIVTKLSISHNSLGGVTNGIFFIYVYHRKGSAVEKDKFDPPMRLNQDLRWILKSNVSGKPAAPPSVPFPVEASNCVNYVGSGIVSSYSLFPFLKDFTQVHTMYLHNMWVHRQLTIKEKLMMMDVPEHFIRRAISTEIEDQYFAPSVPGKVLEWVAVQVMTDSETNEKKRPASFEPDHEVQVQVPIVKRQRISESQNKATTILLKDDANKRVAKNDDAAVPVALWNHYFEKGLSVGVLELISEGYLNIIRRFILRCWRRNVVRSYFEWERNNVHQLDRDLNREAARDCFHRVYGASIWHWDMGSRPFFWRWPADYVEIIRDGLKPYFNSNVPVWQRKQRRPSRPELMNKIRDKLQVVRDKGYVEKGLITSLMPFFDVPKGDDDVRMVYDGSASGLNECIWAPWFPLPTVDSLKRALHPGYYQADNDVGEMFHNFVMHRSLREYCGMDLTIYFGKTDNDRNTKQTWERWNRLAMGLRNSPYTAVQGMLMAQEVILGDRCDVNTNVFHWERIHVNLPGSCKYTPSYPWITKVRSDGRIASDMFIYVDDIRSTSPTQDEAWKASQRISSTLGFLGIQDAARKRRAPSLEAGAWTGSVVWTSNNNLSALTTTEKWEKTKSHLAWIQQHITNGNGMNISVLKSIRGFLVYVARTYTSMVPYLKGLHATIDSWRYGRDTDGWKLPKKRKQDPVVLESPDEYNMDYFDSDYPMEPTNNNEPKFVYPVPRLKDDLHCLLKLTESDKPPLRQIRMNAQGKVVYGFGDASKEGFGASIQLPNQNIFWRFGQWRLQDEQLIHQGVPMNLIKERSSNYRELRNLVEAIEQVFKDGLLNQCELFMFTDNSTAEAAYFKGTSSSRDLFDLVLRLRTIEMSGLCMLHVIHVAGTRMIWQGTDGLSRGDRNAGIMAGESMLSFIPLHKPANERSNAIEPWIKDWYSNTDSSLPPLMILTLEDLFGSHNKSRFYIWIPPPAVGDVALEYLARSVHKRPHSIHAFVCPRLMSSRWMRILNKSMDVSFTIPVGSPIWDSQQHEPLIIAFSFPIHRKSPWQFKLTEECERRRKFVQEMFHTDFTRSGVELCELFNVAWSLV